MNTEDNMKKIIEEVKRLLRLKDILHCLNNVFQSFLGLGSGRFVIPCFNNELVNDMKRKLRENGISSDIPMKEENILRATCCSHFNGCSECRAVCCLRDLLALPEGQNALLDEGLCEKVCRCVLHGAGIFDLSLLFALLRTSPDFGEDSLILFALENCINKAKRSEIVEIAKMFFKATRELNLNFLIWEPRVSAKIREKRFEEIRIMEIELCKTVYAHKIAQIQEEEAAAEAAALEEKKRGMPRCQICFGDPIDSCPVYFPRTCSHKICCENCLDSKDGGEKLKYTCPECQNPFTEHDIWYI